MITLMKLVSQNKRRKACILGLSWVLLTCFEALAQKATVGRIVGHIDGISQDGDHYFLLGWACQQGQSKSIDVQLFGTQTMNGVSKEGPLFAETANLFSEARAAFSLSYGMLVNSQFHTAHSVRRSFLSAASKPRIDLAFLYARSFRHRWQGLARQSFFHQPRSDCVAPYLYYCAVR